MMSRVATNSAITQEEEAAVAEELGMSELMDELRKSPGKEAGNSKEKETQDPFTDSTLFREAAELSKSTENVGNRNNKPAETQDVFTDSLLFREAAEQLDVAAANVMLEVPAENPTPESTFEWNNSTLPSVASQQTEGDSCPVFKHTFPQMTMDVIELPKSSPPKKSPVTRARSKKSLRVSEEEAQKLAMEQLKKLGGKRSGRGRKKVLDVTDDGVVAPKRGNSTR